MSEPARSSASEYEPPAPGWGELRRRIAAAVRAVENAIGETADRAELDGAVTGLLRVTAEVSRMHAERLAAFDEMIADERAMRPGGAGGRRRNLRILPGG